MINIKKIRLFRGWKISALGFLLMCFSYSPGTTLVGLFVPSLMESFQVGAARIVMITSIGIASGSIGSIMAGRWFERFSTIRLLVTSLLITSLGYLGYGLVNSLNLLYFFALIRGFMAAFITIIPINILINRHCDTRFRGRALSIAMLGSGLGSAVLTSVTNNIIETFSWRGGYFFFAILHLLLIPMVYLLLDKNPKEEIHKTMENNSPIDEKKKISLGKREILHLLAFILLAGATQSWSINNAVFLKSVGFSPKIVALLLTISSIFMSLGKISLGTVCDTMGKKQGTYLGYGVLIIGYISLMFSFQPGILVILGIVQMGIGLAAINIIPFVIAPRKEDTNHSTSQLFGMINMAICFGAGVMPLILSYIYDTVQNFGIIWITCLAFIVSSLILVEKASKV